MICNAKAYEGTEPYVFVCYCRKDAGIVYPLIERLARKGCRLWYDSGIHTGEEWPEAIANHLEKSAAMLIFLSEDAVNSHNCRNEVNLGIEIEKPLIPVRYNQAALTMGMRLMLGNIQWIECPEQPTDLLVDRILAAEPLQKCMGRPDQNVLIQAFRVKKEAKEKKILQPSDLASLNRASDGPELPPAVEKGTGSAAAEKKPAEESAETAGQKSQISEADRTEEKNDLPIAPPEDPGRRPAEPLAAAARKAEPLEQEPASRTLKEYKDENHAAAAPLPLDQGEYRQRAEKDFRRSFPAPGASSKGLLSMNEEMLAEETIVESRGPDMEDLEATVQAGNHVPPVIVRLSTGECYRGLPGETMIGRGKMSDVRIVDLEHHIGRQHARLLSLGDICTLTDLQSVNGTWVNGVQLERGGTVSISQLTEVLLGKEKLIIAVSDSADALWRSPILVSICSEKTNETRYLFQGEMALGRNHPWKSGAMTERKIGREHATLRIDGSVCSLIDHSQNGTYVNNEPERMRSGEPRALSSGDRVRMGEETFVIQCIALQKE